MSTSDFSDLLRPFENSEVRYLVVGGYAVMVYTEPRFTKDLDVWVEPTSENAKKVFAALAQFGAPMVGWTVEDFVTPGMVFQIGIAPVRIDILTGVTGIEFADAWVARERRPFLGGSAWFIGCDHLMLNKGCGTSARSIRPRRTATSCTSPPNTADRR
jgi:hypothetical protein